MTWSGARGRSGASADGAPAEWRATDEPRSRRMLSALEEGAPATTNSARGARASGTLAGAQDVPVIGVTGTGGAGKSSRRPTSSCALRAGISRKLQIAVLAIDPTRRRSGGALLGDRIRMNSLARRECLHALDGDAPPAPGDQLRCSRT